MHSINSIGPEDNQKISLFLTVGILQDTSAWIAVLECPLENFLPTPWCVRPRARVEWWSRQESNLRPSHCERDALPTELRPQNH